MAEKLCDLKTAGGDNWPDMTDATPMTVVSGRASSITKNGIKKIGSDYYIEFAGDISIPFTNASYSTVPFLTLPSAYEIDISSVGHGIEAYFYYTQKNGTTPSNYINYGFSLEGIQNNKYTQIRAIGYGSWTYTDSISIRMIVHS